MKYIKMLGLLAVAAAALMAFAGTASATLTEAANDPMEKGDVIEAESEGTTSLDGAIDIACAKSTVKGTVQANGGTSGAISKPTDLTFSECANDTATTISGGTLSINSANEVFSTGAEVTVQLHRVIFFVPITTHCIYATSNTKVGTLTTEGTGATMSIGSAPIPQKTTDDACGDTAEWTGNYKVTQPAYLAVD